jgi:hypothetical protein
MPPSVPRMPGFDHGVHLLNITSVQNKVYLLHKSYSGSLLSCAESVVINALALSPALLPGCRQSTSKPCQPRAARLSLRAIFFIMGRAIATKTSPFARSFHPSQLERCQWGGCFCSILIIRLTSTDSGLSGERSLRLRLSGAQFHRGNQSGRSNCSEQPKDKTNENAFFARRTHLKPF